MATIRKVNLKNNEIKYRIDVKYYDEKTKKYKSKSFSFHPPKNVSETKAMILAEKEAEKYEKNINEIIDSNKPEFINYTDISFEEFATMWLDNSKTEKGITYYEEKKPNVIYLINELKQYKVKDIKPTIIQELFDKIDSRKRTMVTIKAKPEFKELVNNSGWTYSKINSEKKGIKTYTNSVIGKNVDEKSAREFARGISISFNKLFSLEKKIVDYAPETNLKYKKILRLILGKAVKYGLIEKNYASSEYIDYPSIKKPKIDVMDEKEVKIFYDTLLKLDNIKVKTALMISLLTGFRRGEVIGLRWSDISFKNMTITVNRSIRWSKELGFFVKDPKTESSHRTITIPDILVNQLKEYKECQDNEKIINNPLEYLFPNEYGDTIRLDQLEKWMNRVLDKANIKHHTLHSLRHTNVALQIAAGVPIVTVASRAGHSKTSTTTDIYAYSFKSIDKKAAQAIGTIFEDKTFDNKPINNDDESLLEFKKAREEMKKLGFFDMDEYLDYKKYMNRLSKKRGEIY